MPDLSILNTLIAMVIVILVLSLIVQSLQTFVKKFFKLKSRSIRNSLVDLFETITVNPDGTAASGGKGPNQLLDEVTGQLREMGRKTLFGRVMLDSLAKGDLLKVLTRVEANNLLPGSVEKFEAVLGAVGELKTEFGKIATDLLEGDASARFAALQAAVMPLVNDIEALATGGKINPKVLLGDLYNLRQIKAAEVFDLLGQIQQKVGQDLEAATKADAAAQKTLAEARAAAADPARVTAAEQAAGGARGQLDGLKLVAGGLKNIADLITKLGRAFDSAFAPLRERLAQAEVWYDTVMQGFEERYTRHMRTVALVISIIVVVLLNANFFSIYRAIAADPVKTAALADRTDSIIKQSKLVIGGAPTTPTPAPAVTPTPAATAPPAASPAPSPAETPVTLEDLKKQGDEVNELVGTYKSFGIEPLTWRQFYNGLTFNAPAGDIFDTLIGWAIMVMLLSAGAPFWQDTLESLFGLKNLLRQKSDTKNIEEGKGGQPKP